MFHSVPRVLTGILARQLRIRNTKLQSIMDSHIHVHTGVTAVKSSILPSFYRVLYTVKKTKIQVR